MNSKISDVPFFFIIGRPRSGTTLLTELFDAHPNIIVPIEFPVIIELSYKYSKKTNWTKTDLEEFYNDLFKIKYSDLDRQVESIGMSKVNIEKFQSDLYSCEGNTSFASLIKLLYSNMHSPFPKEEILLLGDKNPIYSMYCKYIINLFPDSKIIHIVRDYRDHIISVLETKLYKIPSVALVAYQWKRSLRMIQKQKKKQPERFFTIRYEDLVNNPEIEVPQLFEFLNISYNDAVLNFNERVKEKYSGNNILDEIQKRQSNILNPINNKMVNKWQTQMSKESQEIADIIVGNYAEKYGYQRTYKSGINKYIFPILLLKVYVQTQYLLRFIINPLPFKTKYKIKKRNSIFMTLFSKIFKKV